jgi:hypothetical protein
LNRASRETERIELALECDGVGAAARHDASDDLLAPFLMPAADDRDFGDRCMRLQHFLDLARIDVGAAADDQILRPILERQESVAVLRAEIAGVQPAAGERIRRSLGVAPIALHHRRPAHQYFADGAGDERRIPRAADPDFDARLRDPDRCNPAFVIAGHCVGQCRTIHRGDRHRRLALTVNLREARAERGERGLAILDIHRTATVDDAFQAIEPRILQLRRDNETLDHRRRREEQRALPMAQERNDFRRIEAAGLRHDVDGAARNMRQNVESRTVRHRRCVQDGVAGRDRFDIDQEAFDHCAQVGVRDDHAFRPAGSSAGVKEPRWRVAIHGNDLRRSFARQQCLVIVRAETNEAARRPRRQRRFPHIVDKCKTRTAVGKHERQLLRMQFGIDGNGDQSRPPTGEQRFDIRGRIARTSARDHRGRPALVSAAASRAGSPTEFEYECSAPSPCATPEVECGQLRARARATRRDCARSRTPSVTQYGCGCKSNARVQASRR